MLHTEVEVPSYPMRTFQFFTGILLLWNNILLLEWHLGNGLQIFGDRNGLFVFIDIHKLHYIYAYFLYRFHKSFSVIIIISQCIYIPVSLTLNLSELILSLYNNFEEVCYDVFQISRMGVLKILILTHHYRFCIPFKILSHVFVNLGKVKSRVLAIYLQKN